VYVGDWFGNLRAHSAADGAPIWEKSVSAFAIDDSPLVMGGKVYAGDGGGNLIAVDQATGELLWTADLDPHPQAHVYSSPIGVGDLVMIGIASIELVTPVADYTFRGSVVGVDAATGMERWRVHMTTDDANAGAGVSVWSSVSVDTERKIAYIGTGQTYEEPASPLGDALVAIRYEEGTIAWSRQFTTGDVFTIGNPSGPDFDIGATPNLFSADGADWVSVGDKGGRFAVLDRETGQDKKWEKELSQGSPQGGVMDSAAYAGGVLFVASNEFRVGGSFDDPLEGDVHFTYALRVESGDEVWKREDPFPSVGGLAHANGVVFNATTDGTVHAYDAGSGDELWSDKAGALMASGPSVAEGMLFVTHGFTFFKTGGGIIDGGLVAYGLP
jgi:polyvinyl alcohol dehydrogenase (cytochrome)